MALIPAHTYVAPVSLRDRLRSHHIGWDKDDIIRTMKLVQEALSQQDEAEVARHLDLLADQADAFADEAMSEVARWTAQLGEPENPDGMSPAEPPTVDPYNDRETSTQP